MKQNNLKLTLVASCLLTAFTTNIANASHFRGAAVVPQVDATGLLTVDAKSFWRQQSGATPGSFPHSGVTGSSALNITGGSIVGGDSLLLTAISQDLTDSRRAEVNEDFSIQLPGAGTYTLNWQSTSWVSGVPNGSGTYGTTSTIFWDGSSSNTPIVFDLENIQQEVLRGSEYTGQLAASGTGLTYDDSFLATGMSSQATGFSIDASGNLDIAATDTAGYSDNIFNDGADQAFSGQINSTDGSSVQFVWLFDAVDVLDNQAPLITDVVINALVGDIIDETLVVTDPDGDAVTVSLLSLADIGGVPIGNSTFDTTSLDFSWDTSSFGIGSYLATFFASDGSLTDQGTIRIELTAGVGNPNPNPVSAPSGTAVIAIGLLGLLGLGRRKKK